MRWLPLVFCLSACTTDPKVPSEVNIQVKVPCVEEADIPSSEGLLSDDDLIAMDEYKRTIALWDDRRARQKAMDAQSAVLNACKKVR